MPSRRRSKPNAPIRKRRAKQTLARVVERRDAREAALARRLEAAEGRERDRRTSAGAAAGANAQLLPVDGELHLRGKKRKRETALREIESSSGEDGNIESGGEDEIGEDADTEALCATAFDNLVTTLTRNGATNTAKKAPRNTGSDSGSIASSGAQSRGKKITAGGAGVKDTVTPVLETPDAAAVDRGCREQATREMQHFRSSYRPPGTEAVGNTYDAMNDPVKAGETKPVSKKRTVITMPGKAGADGLRVVGHGVGSGAASELTEAITPQAGAAAHVGVTLGLQPAALARWTGLGMSIGGQDGMRVPEVRVVATAAARYHDVMTATPTDAAGDDAMRSVVVAHAVSHVVRARARVTRNNARVRARERGDDDKADDKTVDANEDEQIENDDLMKDQGYTRARVLFLVPMRNVAYKIVKLLTALVVGDDKKKRGGAQVANSERFEEEFGPDPALDADEDEEHDEETDNEGEGKEDGAARRRKRKPEDHRRTFSGNIDDDFRLGVALSGKSGVRLFSDFFDSDFIISSPLGLRRAWAERVAGVDATSRARKREAAAARETEWHTGDQESGSRVSGGGAEGDEKSFLSSVEIAVVVGADILAMQNWSSLQRALGSLNQVPRSVGGTDFARVRMWCLDGLMSAFRQTIVLGRQRSSALLALARTYNTNYRGAIHVLAAPVTTEAATITAVSVPMRQTFLRVPPSTKDTGDGNDDEKDDPAKAPQARLDFFMSHLLPTVRDLVDSAALVVVPTYFDFVRVRNRLVTVAEENHEFRFASMCEYSRAKDVTRARARLFDRTVSVVLVTERFHFFWRHYIRGACTIVWYGLPHFSHFYPELLDMTEEQRVAGRPVQAFALYDRFDTFVLERVVGNQRAKRMLSLSAPSTFVFT